MRTTRDINFTKELYYRPRSWQMLPMEYRSSYLSLHLPSEGQVLQVPYARIFSSSASLKSFDFTEILSAGRTVCITVCSKRAKMIIQFYLLCRFLAKQCLEVSQPCLVRNCPDFQVQSWWRPHFHPKCFQSRVRPLRTVRIRRFQCCRLNSPR